MNDMNEEETNEWSKKKNEFGAKTAAIFDLLYFTSSIEYIAAVHNKRMAKCSFRFLWAHARCVFVRENSRISRNFRFFSCPFFAQTRTYETGACVCLCVCMVLFYHSFAWVFRIHTEIECLRVFFFSRLYLFFPIHKMLSRVVQSARYSNNYFILKCEPWVVFFSVYLFTFDCTYIQFEIFIVGDMMRHRCGL